MTLLDILSLLVYIGLYVTVYKVLQYQEYTLLKNKTQ